MNNVSFQGRTQLIFDKSIYDKVTTRQLRKSFTNLDTCDDEICKLYKTRFTACNPNEMIDTGVIIFNEKGGMFFRNAQNKINDIVECIDKLKTSAKEKLTAWIIGGQRGENTERSVGALAEVLCDRPDIDTSIIAGQRTVAPNITLYPHTDKLDMNLGMQIKNENEVENALNKYYDIVELNNTSLA